LSSGALTKTRHPGPMRFSGRCIGVISPPPSGCAPKTTRTTLLVLTCMRYPLIKKEDTHGYTRQSSLVARVGRVFGHLPGALPSPGGRGRLGALPDRVAHRIAQQELRHYGGCRPRDQ